MLYGFQRVGIWSFISCIFWYLKGKYRIPLNATSDVPTYQALELVPCRPLFLRDEWLGVADLYLSPPSLFPVFIAPLCPYVCLCALTIRIYLPIPLFFFNSIPDRTARNAGQLDIEPGECNMLMIAAPPFRISPHCFALPTSRGIRNHCKSLFWHESVDKSWMNWIALRILHLQVVIRYVVLVRMYILRTFAYCYHHWMKNTWAVRNSSVLWYSWPNYFN